MEASCYFSGATQLNGISITPLARTCISALVSTVLYFLPLHLTRMTRAYRVTIPPLCTCRANYSLASLRDFVPFVSVSLRGCLIYFLIKLYSCEPSDIANFVMGPRGAALTTHQG